MTAPRISLCTYACNDAPLVHDLLRTVSSWTVRPDEIVVVDDGSRAPFAPEPGAPESGANGSGAPEPRVVRLAQRQGVTRAKGRGISEARGEIILSLDCDTRLAPDWLEVNLPNLSRAVERRKGRSISVGSRSAGSRSVRPISVGMVGGALEQAVGDDLVSRYLRLFGDARSGSHIGPLDFVPGNAFLIRRAVWEEVGGLSAYAGPDCQDHYLCELLLSRGYTPFSDARARAWVVRRLRRTALCKRVWRECQRAVKAQMLPGERLVPYLFEVGARPMLSRFETGIESGEPLFLYIDLLYLAHLTLDCLDHAVAAGMASDLVRAGFRRRLAMLFEGYPRLWERLRADLGVMGHSVLMPAAGDEAAWEDFFLFADMLRNSGLFQWMEREGLRTLMVEDRAEAGPAPAWLGGAPGMAPAG